VDKADLTDLLREHASSHSVPGAAIGVLHAGASKTAYYGVENVTTGEAVTSKTRFSVGSLTKPMVATVVACLAEEGLLVLDDPVAAQVPELRRVGWAERATLRDLLANRSGLPLRNDLEFGFAARKEQQVARLAEDLAAAVPGSDVWSYSNVGWCLLGRAIEAATGVPWEDAMRRHLFDSAGMRQTTFATDGVPKPRVLGHALTAKGLVPVEPLISRAYAPAGASVMATLTDVLRFAALHLDDSSLAAMRAIHGEISICGWFDAWCLGWARFDWEGSPVWGWDGLVNGERSVLRIVPEHHAAIALMTNSDTGRAMYRSLFPDLMRSLFAISVPPLRLDPAPSADDLSRFAGAYAWPDRRVEVTDTASALIIRSEHRETEALPLDDRTFLVDASDPDNPTVTFGTFDAAGQPQVLYLMLWGLPRLDEGGR
jgi:CubicO group peptidase (beta-lactamase class C family)